MRKLNLGCGDKFLTGFINCDLNKSVKADLYFDLNKFPYPFNKNSIDLVLMDNVLEHLNDVLRVMEEIYRILKPKGVLELYFPYAKSDGAFQDPAHKHFFTEKSMEYFTVSKYKSNNKMNFRVLEKRLFNANKTRLSKIRLLIPFKFILKYFLFNIYDGLFFKLEAIK